MIDENGYIVVHGTIKASQLTARDWEEIAKLEAEAARLQALKVLMPEPEVKETLVQKELGIYERK